MVTTRSKMKESNKKARRWLFDNGYSDIMMFPHTRFSKDLNFDDLKFDGICKSENRICLFQIKTNRKPSKEMEQKFIEFGIKYNCHILWFNCIDGDGVPEVYGSDIR